ncbi:hypothetical protein DPMN_175323 [Dreissena polymorpha]|uniref:Uncharacterized protein n=1 Tax=Dreissena polymorpha TaxID=45954 RepID=A0A9D4E500_DREPO|nr:hypothetical protein DPMN_175323 [Dreissena polymorpha]
MLRERKVKQGKFRAVPNANLNKPPKKTVTITGKDVAFSMDSSAIPLTNDKTDNRARLNLIRPTLNEQAASREGIANFLRQGQMDIDGNEITDDRFDPFSENGMTNDSKEACSKILETVSDDAGVEFIQDGEGKPIINLTGMPISDMDATHVPVEMDITTKGVIIGQGLTHADTCSSDQSKANRSGQKYRIRMTGKWVYPYKPGTKRADVNTFTRNPERASLQVKTDALTQEMRKVLTDTKVKPDVMFPVASVLQQAIEIQPVNDTRVKSRVAKTAVIDKVTKKARDEYYKPVDGNQSFDSAGAVTSALIVATKIPSYFTYNNTKPNTYADATSNIIDDGYNPSTREISHKRFAGPDEISFIPEKKRKP